MNMNKMKAMRKDSLHHFGFGTEEMMNLTVCSSCHSLEESHNKYCSKCNMKLSKSNLYDLYRSYHKKCSKCGMVISASMHYCPSCGKKIKTSGKNYSL